VNRRDFLGAFIAAASCGLMLPTKASALVSPVMVASTVALLVQTTAGLVSLFQRSGPGISDLLSIQTQMLKHISDEIAVVQLGVTEILKRVDELSELVGAVPTETVRDLFKSQIAGKEGRYVEVMNTYYADVAESGIASARKKMEPELTNDVIRPLRDARDSVLRDFSFSLVPAVCTAALVETNAMIVVGERSTRMGQAIKRYRSWFETVTHGQAPSTLEGAIAAASATQAKLTTDATVDKSYSCHTSASLGYVLQCQSAGNNSVSFDCTTLHATTGFRRLKEPAAVASVVKEMIDSGVLPRSERPSEVVVETELTSPIVGEIRCNNTGQPPSPSRASRCPDEAFHLACADQKAALESQAAAWSKGLTSGGLKLVSLRAFKKAADEGMAFLDRLQKSIDDAQPHSVG
jgi:hypothetical protein